MPGIVIANNNNNNNKKKKNTKNKAIYETQKTIIDYIYLVI